mmetsp:Transcript_8025/g.13349  ORF Transcript_8025/g.13349 Transcript_8025/m.13349 type:complete len:120 (-) Transcript_8025:117-476(-)
MMLRNVLKLQASKSWSCHIQRISPPGTLLPMHGLFRMLAVESQKPFNPPPPPPPNKFADRMRWLIIGTFSAVLCWVYLKPRHDYDSIGADGNSSNMPAALQPPPAGSVSGSVGDEKSKA